MKGKHKKSDVTKHRGNPHGNAPHMDNNRGKNVSDDNLRQSGNTGVSESPKLKQ